MTHACWFAVFLILAGASVVLDADGAADAITALKPLHLETRPGEPGAPQAAIVAGPAYARLARELQARIHGAAGVRLPVVSDADALTDLGKQHLIVLGQFGDNKVIEHFYYRWYLVVDGVQPGKGGYVLETVHNPDALGINLIVVGGGWPIPTVRHHTSMSIVRNGEGRLLPAFAELDLNQKESANP